MRVIEWIVVGLLVVAAAVYAVRRLRRALQGREGCSFISGDGPPCANCPGGCTRPEAGDGRPEPPED